ncbi:hypothetical protein CAC42_2169 [Sphaceloma murrayae]|uniref:Rhodopsin domain-containing protein n=1 Tax=Sphaceloma murrayae TaxID=2082308 RepID=A0A2K1QJ67_9PEZI|nr:hypothetical protein CAC42_2169 [Sphaceloma murrayae]
MSSPTVPSQGDRLPHEVVTEFPLLKSFAIALLIVVNVTFALRVYVKIGILGKFRSDDIALTISYLLFWPLGVIACLFANWGAYLNRGDYSVIPAVTSAAKVYYSTYAACAVSCKISVMLLVLSLLGPHDRWQRMLAMGITGLTTILGIIYFAFCFTCGVTDIAQTSTTCTLYTASNTVSLAWSFSNTAADIIFAFLCVTLIWRATMALRTRIVASCLLSFSSIGAIASALRIATILGWDWTTFDGERLRVTRWSLIEAGICIAAICLASLRPLLKKLSLDGSSYGASGGQYYMNSTTQQRKTMEGTNRHGDEVPLKIGVQHVFEVEEGIGPGPDPGQHSLEVERRSDPLQAGAHSVNVGH